MGLSRNEDILQSIVDGTQYTDPPKSRVEDLLLQVKEVIEEGGGGTSDYDDLENKPQIGGVTLSGNKSAADLSLASLDVNGKVPAAQLPSYVDDIINGYLHDGKFYEDDQYTTEITAEDGKIYVDLATNKTYRWSGLAYVEVSESLALGETSSTAYAGDKGKANADAITAIKDGQTIDSFGDVETALSGKQDTLTFDNAPTENSNNPVKSGGVYSALAGKQGTLTAGDYINLNNGNIAVNRNIVRNNYAYNIKFSGDNDLTVTKSQGGTVISTTQYTYEYGSGGGVTYTIDDVFTLETIYYGGQYFKYTALRDSTTHSAGYTWQVDARDTSTDVTEYFSTEDLSGYKLVIKSEMDTALSGKQDTLTFDSVPTDGSTNPVESNGVYDALATKQNATDNNLQTTDKTVVGAVNELKSGLTTLDNEVNGDATVHPYADVITIEDAVPSNLADCSVKIEPVQDLHGYDKPWVGGASKNKLPLVLADIKAANTDGTWNDNVYTINNGTITVNTDDGGNVTSIKANGTFSAVISFVLWTKAGIPYPFESTSYTMNGCNGGSGNTYKQDVFYRKSGVDNVLLTALNREATADFSVLNDETVSGVAVRIVIYAGTLTNQMFYPMLRLATETDATFAPYTNYCPISGHTESVVTVERPNLLVDADWVDNKYITQDGSIGNMEGMYRYTDNYIDVSGNTLYAIHEHQNVATNLAMAVAYYDSGKTFIRRDIVVETSGVSDYTAQFTTPANCRYVRANVALQSNDVMMQEGVFGHETYTIVLGDTIYGGTVDFDSGVMTVTHQYVTKNTSTMNNLEQYPGWTGSGIKQIVGGGIDGVISTCVNVSDVIRANTLNINDILFFEKNDIGLTQTELIALAIDVALVVELTTPTTIQLTPQQIQLLKGTNTLYASTGQISVTANGVSGSIGEVQTQANATDAALAELAEQLPTAPTTDGAYVLTVTVADGTPTYSWESAT